MKAARLDAPAVGVGPSPPPPGRGKIFWSWFIPAAAVVIIFLPALVWMNARFWEENSYYSHSWLIPAAVAYLVYQRWAAILAAPPRPSRTGLVLLAAGLSFHLLAQFFQINFLSAAALPVVVFSLVLARWGLGRAKHFIGPLLLTAFMIPLPGIWIIAITFRLKMAAVDIGVALGRALTIPIVQSGIEIILPTSPPGETLRIGDPCSGLRSLFSFGALGGFFALLLPLSLPRRTAVFITAVLLAPFSNILRVISLIVLRQTVGPGILSGFWHIALGVLIFFFCFLLFLQVTRWLLR